ncbi:unnamed protein product [Periconia digitata]|uniref:Uncharacterized protein n=1 Tax=Periconia digitata TaxID=1303443 RepID=A0A9W4U7V2_9PLEO|nr:unnamed protein product [Periconia digitata]
MEAGLSPFVQTAPSAVNCMDSRMYPLRFPCTSPSSHQSIHPSIPRRMRENAQIAATDPAPERCEFIRKSSPVLPSIGPTLYCCPMSLAGSLTEHGTVEEKGPPVSPSNGVDLTCVSRFLKGGILVLRPTTPLFELIFSRFIIMSALLCYYIQLDKYYYYYGGLATCMPC